MTEYEIELERQRQRERERAAIKREIDALYKKIVEANEIITDFNTCSVCIGDSLTDWSSAHMAYQGNEMASVVMVTDRFEGCIAEQMATEIPEALAPMKLSVTWMQNVNSGIAVQVQALHRYKEQIQEKINSLWNRFYSI